MNKNTEVTIFEKPLNAIDVFSGIDGAESLISELESTVRSVVSDVSTSKGRGEIKSLAYKISRTKTTWDTFGKDVAADWKLKAKKVDVERRLIRDRLDDLRDEVRDPLTNWEMVEAEKTERARMEKEIQISHELAILENDLFDFRLESVRREEEAERLAQEQAEKEQAEKEQAERVERDVRIAKEAAEKATRDAKELAERVAIEVKEAAEKAKAKAESERIRLEMQAVEAKAAELRAKSEQEQAEKNKLQEIAAAEQRSLDQARHEQEEIERVRIAKEAAENAAAEKKAANVAHQKRINREIIGAFGNIGIADKDAKAIITGIIKGSIPHMKIIY